MTSIGFVGLGSMGGAMAARLVDAGHHVTVWNRSPGPVATLVHRGAYAAATPEEVLKADISFSMLANDAAADAVLIPSTSADGAHRTHVMMASISPSTADVLDRRFTDAGSTYISAPVLGRPDVAAAGNLNILAAGPSIDSVEPLLLEMGKRVWRLGDKPSIANAVKAIVNYNIIHALQAIGESVTMTERLGVSPELFTELLSSTLFGGVAYTGYGNLIAQRRYMPPGFHMSLGRKDLDLAQQVASSVDFAPATMPVLIEVLDAALADPELAQSDWSAIAEVSRRSHASSPPPQSLKPLP
ncbi:NAD(P)-dependent oxidoreductase [Rhodococcus sp. 1R11]|uniref:NAD(P)-dependent oxidoreductase n=1 Tax=Rhodococcus sp. 1R11 TaxID=2559614 RepID=UPI0010723EF6|nr:NAD(P)-dependent oxidoreductase [Rhodococcus sp. 1R11]TFI42472.1 NAD(P)-dependent oxidoreductase [Rhodococcus sp. 1R11]